MEKSNPSSEFQELTSSPIANEFNTFNANQILEAKRIMLAEPSNSRILDFSRFLLNENRQLIVLN